MAWHWAWKDITLTNDDPVNLCIQTSSGCNELNDLSQDPLQFRVHYQGSQWLVFMTCLMPPATPTGRSGIIKAINIELYSDGLFYYFFLINLYAFHRLW